MNFDRGFIKWQPFNSVAPSKEFLNFFKESEKQEKPILFPEELEKLNEQIKEAYYGKNKINLTFYENNKVKTIETIILEIDTSKHIIKLKNNKKITFSQIISLHF